ncbi:zwei Ig domain protein zig-8-like [Portunus trituberculatus]|uniref:zwei Ig domain protein zig-8-like n=1 Tax=Portunus trituberculatus TaxID=210409 RepID=UPI001E1CF916|nr:zwei Ig domain protein zig-8-like [Portunus trituberculatus]
MKSLCVLLLDAILLASFVEDSETAGRHAAWSKRLKNVLETHRFKTEGGSWTPDPSDLLGEYEVEPPVRDTNAYFMTDNNTVVTVQVGTTAALRCQVFDVAEHETVSWIRRRDHHLITVGANTYSNDERFQVTYSEKTQDWTLHVRYAQPHDAGVYECQLSAHPPIGVITTLNVIEAVAEIGGGPERYVQIGSSVQLTCTIKHFTEPPTYVFWYHAEHMINYDSNKRITVVNRLGESELRISQVTKADSGNYTCQPANARPAFVSLHIITGETPAAMQRASATEVQYRLSITLLSSLLALVAL